jgi:hypothetical protein
MQLRATEITTSTETRLHDAERRRLDRELEQLEAQASADPILRTMIRACRASITGGRVN